MRHMISNEEVQQAAAAMGRKKGFTGEAGRLAMADVHQHVQDIRKLIKVDVANSRSREEVIHGMALALWIDWLSAEVSSRRKRA